jgi:hypothetical protein
MEFDKAGIAILIDESVRMDTKSFHHAVTPWDAPVAH